MYKKFTKQTLDQQLSSKTIKCGKKIQNLNEKVMKYFCKTFQLYEKLFTIIKNQSSFYSKPQPLRHPLIFYLGHTATFYVNKMIDGGIINKRINQHYQRVFAVGVDQNDWDDLDSNHYTWPSVAQVMKFRQQVKNTVIQAIQNIQQQIINCSGNMWTILMAIDHERLHLQTSAVIIRRLPSEELMPQDWLKQCPFRREKVNDVPFNKMLTVPSVNIKYNKSMEDAEYYGWDVQFGTKQIITKQFNASKMLVSNGQYLEFYLDQGYKKYQYWTEEGVKWLKSTQTIQPVFWTIKQDILTKKKTYCLKTLSGDIPMPWDWPAEVNNLQARAFCNWKSNKINKNIRLPTEDEYFALRNLLKTDYQNWQYQSVGNINLQFWCSPCPVDLFQTNQFCDIVGNVWQHTITSLYTFQNFKVHPLYDDFTTPCVDQRHDIMKGGSFITTGNSASLYYRVGFRKHFHQFAGFRYVQSDNPTSNCNNCISQTDQKIEQALRFNYIQKDTYTDQILQYINKKIDVLGDVSLTVGCSVGKFPLQLSKYFQKSYGIDYTARYFQMATRLLQKGSLKYKNTSINLSDYNLNEDILSKVRLYQMNPQNTDQNKINNVTFALIDCFNIKKGTVHNVVSNCLKLLKKQQKCHLLFISDNNSNKMTSHEIEKLFKQIENQTQSYTVLDCFEVVNQSNGVNQTKIQNCYYINQCFFIELKVKE